MRAEIQALLVVGAVLLAPFSHASNDGAVITLERTACLGTCPVYKLTITEDGTVQYEGKEYVRINGRRSSKIDESAVKELLQAFADANYFELKDSYTSIQNADGTETVVSDLPSTYTSLTLDRRHKKIDDYVGAPKELLELENKIDEVVNSKRWVAIDAPSIHEEVAGGWNIRSDDAQRLMLSAAQRGDAEVVEAFLAEGADANALIVNVRLLQEARGLEVVKALLAAGADPNATSKEYFGPPLVHAAELGDAEAIVALIAAGAKVNSRSPSGETPLMKAANSGNPEAVSALLHAGADVNARDNYGEGALEYAEHGSEHQQDLARSPGPFEEPIPDYRAKYGEIRAMLIAAGAVKNQP